MLVSVICCKWSTLGDGGNDVSMIQAANVGIGIVGKVRMRECMMHGESVGGV